ncbi:MAG TPA: aminofutalosine synthase MqnE [Desulfosporosinus sp.]|nr:aminofutalosine synthase MqnE [Desulfosporosinus sp.]
MLSLFAQSELSDLVEKVEKGEQLDFEAGVRMIDSRDILALGYMANLVRERKNGNQTYFIVNRHLNHTNDLQAFTLALEEIATTARNARQETIAEIHIDGGLNYELPFGYYIETLQRVKNIFPQVCIQAFTAVDVEYFTQITGLGVSEVLQCLIEAGLDSLSGGGTEVFFPRWLEIQEVAHRLGMRTNASLLYGHRESTGEQIDQLLQLRTLQDRTGGFQTFSPLPVCSIDVKLEGNMGVENTTGFEDLKMLAISRILLDNFDHIKTFWIMLGPKLAQVSLAFGVDDLETSQAMSKRALIHMINKAGRDAVERDALYRAHKTD